MKNTSVEAKNGFFRQKALKNVFFIIRQYRQFLILIIVQKTACPIEFCRLLSLRGRRQKKPVPPKNPVISRLNSDK